MFVDPTTGDYRLQADSLAIDTGVELFEGLASVSTDLDLNPRLVDGDGDETPVVDIGAYEYQPPTNTAPTIDAITASPDPVNVNDQPTVEVAFSDPDAGGSHDVTFDWGDGSSDTLSGAASPATASHPYDEAGVYEVTVTVTDAAGESDSATYQYIVVYDPDGGFVTGGGWIDSPAGAYVSNSDAEGKATFGFVSKYKKGATLPSGNTQFQFKAGDLNFISDSYDWLVVTGSNYAKFKGTGTINGAGTYKFQIWAGDNSPDTFRIKIWTEEGEVETVVYDNGMDQAIGGGSIVVHTK